MEGATIWIFKLFYVFLSFIIYGNANFANGNKTVQLLVTEDHGSKDAVLSNYIHQLQQDLNDKMKFQVVLTNLKYSSRNFNLICDHKKYDSCLIMKSSSVSATMTEDIFLLRPTLLFVTSGFQINFTNVFHSSVWSFLLLAVLMNIGLLAGFELLHPFGYKLQQFWNFKHPEKLTLPDTVRYIFGSLFLQAPSKRPLSNAGSILALFWGAFCLLIVAFFLAGVLVTVLVSSQASGRWLSAVPSEPALPVTCASDDTFCELVRRLPCDGGSQSRKCDLLGRVKPSSRSALSIWNSVKMGELGLITDSLTASSLLEDHGNMSAVLLGPPTASLALRTQSEALQRQLNAEILRLREKAGISDGTGGQQAGGRGMLERLAEALPLRLHTTAGVFYLSIFGACVAILVLMTEFAVRTFVTKDHTRPADEESLLPNDTKNLKTGNEGQDSHLVDYETRV